MWSIDFGFQGGFRFLDHDIFRISAFATAGAIRDHIDLVAFLELGHSGPIASTIPETIPARNVRQGKRERHPSSSFCSRFPVDRIYRGSMDLYQQFIGFGGWARCIFEAEHFWPS